MIIIQLEAPKILRHLKKHEAFEVLEQDITSPIAIEMDEIFNLACPASPKQYQNDPVETIAPHNEALNVLNAACKNDAKVFQASTSEAYGNPQTHPQPENYWGNVLLACGSDMMKVSIAETLFDFHRQFLLI